MVNATTYDYKVRAVDGAGNRSGFSNTASVTTPDTQNPTPPTQVNATAFSSTQVDLTWTAGTDNVGVTNYEIYRDATLLTTLGAVTSYTDSSVSPSTTYAYQLKAVDAAGNHSGLQQLVVGNHACADRRREPDGPGRPGGNRREPRSDRSHVDGLGR